MATVPAPAREIQLDRVAKRFGEVVAVDGVSLDIAAGEFFSLLGPSGCGKTTTLRMIGGFELPTARPDRAPRTATSPATRPTSAPVNMVFQNYALFPHLDVGDNIAFGPEAPGRCQGRDQAARRRGASTLVHLDGYEKRKPEPAVGRPAAAGRARPGPRRTGPTCCSSTSRSARSTSSSGRQLQVELKRIQSEVGITFVYVTHDQEEALTMSDRIAVMNAGRVEQLGTPEELYERPRTRFVADFIGTSNLLSGAVESVDGLTRRRPTRGRRAVRHRDRARPRGRARGRAQRPPGGGRPARAERGRPDRRGRHDPRHGRAGCVSRGQRPIPRPHRRRAADHRPCAEGRETASRSAATSTSRGRPATRSCSPSPPLRRRRSRHERPIARLGRRPASDELRLRRSPSAGSPAGSCSRPRPRSARSPPSAPILAACGASATPSPRRRASSVAPSAAASGAIAGQRRADARPLPRERS